MHNQDEIDPRLARKLSLLDAAPRSPQQAADGRAQFMAQAQTLVQAVPAEKEQRHKRWMHTIQTYFLLRRKDRSLMFNILAALLITTVAVLGGGGVTVAAAQFSQPGQFLYNVKLASEDIRLSLATDPQTEAALALEFANRRAEEMQTMLQADGVPPEVVQTRYQSQVEQSIRVASGMPDNQALQALQQIQTRLETQLQNFQQIQPGGSQGAGAVLLQTQTMLQERLQWVETGLEEPAQLREQLHLREQVQQNTTEVVVPLSSDTPEPGTQQDAETTSGETPASAGQGGNPWTEGTPPPYSGYGPGPGPSVTCTCTPGTGSGPYVEATQQQMNQPTWAGPQATQSSSGGGNGQGGRP